MFEGRIAAGFVIDHDGADAVMGQVAADDDGGETVAQDFEEDAAFFKEPVGDNR